MVPSCSISVNASLKAALDPTDKLTLLMFLPLSIELRQTDKRFMAAAGRGRELWMASCAAPIQMVLPQIKTFAHFDAGTSRCWIKPSPCPEYNPNDASFINAPVCRKFRQ